MSDAVTTGLFSIAAALIGVGGTLLVTKLGKTEKKISVLDFGIENLTAQLLNSGFDVIIRKGDQSVGSVYQNRVRLQNIGNSSIDNIEVHFNDKASIAKILGINVATISPVSKSSISWNKVSDFHAKCLVGHMNPKGILDLVVLYDDQPTSPNFEVKSSDFVVYTRQDLAWRERRLRLITAFVSALLGGVLSWASIHNFWDVSK